MKKEKEYRIETPTALGSIQAWVNARDLVAHTDAVESFESRNGNRRVCPPEIIEISDDEDIVSPRERKRKRLMAKAQGSSDDDASELTPPTGNRLSLAHRPKDTVAGPDIVRQLLANSSSDPPGSAPPRWPAPTFDAAQTAAPSIDESEENKSEAEVWKSRPFAFNSRREEQFDRLRKGSYWLRVEDSELPLSGPHRVRKVIEDRLSRITGPPITVFNAIDDESPPLDFTFISNSILRPGVNKYPDEFMGGCACRPDNGRNIGCEYRKCSCLDGMADDRRKFPYTAVGEMVGTLRPAVLETRDAIFECNPNCACGPRCKNKLVQWGRQVPLEIFKTPDRGWGLRCLVNLRRGDFVDTYKGEVITEAECRKRDLQRQLKDVYTFSLDKFHTDNPSEYTKANKFVVDGELFGGPTRFINHSCDPNLRQFTVSYNHSDPCIYELAFFAVHAIPAGTELTFDYVDKDAEEGNVEASAFSQEGMTSSSPERDPYPSLTMP
ncbi:MAG: hypothetical protein M1825_004106 [Sarcosagium campestre]|nr:MAG: hypothetical protein M1825_004106 [Sarcosagium campestre]